jgi:D-arginine dehydrogenase
MQQIDVLIVGGGVAGASLAYHLVAGEGGGDGNAASAGRRLKVRLVERSPRPGAHASGRNARLVLQSVPEPLVRRLTAASAEVYARRAREVGFERCGSLLLGSSAAFEPLRDAAIASEVVSAEEARVRVPYIGDCEFEAVLFTPGDGVLDPQMLLGFYLDGARAGGAEIVFDAEVVRIAGEGPFDVETTAGAVRAERIVDAGGAWAGELAACAGASPLPLVAYKRHLFLHRVEMPRGLPWVWHLAREVYCRADSEGVLSCMCDEEPTVALAETVDDGAEELLRERVRPLLPAIAGVPLVRAWSCFRTKAPDSLPVIGPDPRRAAFWWLAGLGGFGLGSSWEMGRIAARALVEGVETLPPEVLPARL